MEERQKAFQWMLENNKWGKGGDFLDSFKEKLDLAIQKQDRVITTWVMGSGLSKNGSAYKLRWDQGTFTVSEIHGEEAAAQDTPDMSFTVYEKEIETIDEQPVDINNPEVAEYIDKAWQSFSIVDQENELREPTSKKQIEQGQKWLAKAKALNPQDSQSKEWIHELEDYFTRWEKRVFDGSRRDMVILAILIVFSFGSMIWGTISGSGGESSEGISMTTIVLAIVFWAGAIGYYWASKAPQWLIDKRLNKGRIKISDRIARANRPQHEYVQDKWGNMYRITHGNILIIGIFWLIYYYIFLQFIPVWTGINFFRNYVHYS